MSLFGATFLFGLGLALLGGWMWKAGPEARSRATGWMRSSAAAYLLFGPASIWFLWHVWNLGAADFGSFRHLLILVFGVTCFGSFFYVRDLLAVRGVAALFLLSALPMLNAAYMRYEEPQRLLLVLVIYLGIVGAIIVGAMPWRLRDFVNWLYDNAQRVRRVAMGLGLYGVLLLLVSFTY